MFSSLLICLGFPLKSPYRTNQLLKTYEESFARNMK